MEAPIISDFKRNANEYWLVYFAYLSHSRQVQRTAGWMIGFLKLGMLDCAIGATCTALLSPSPRLTSTIRLGYGIQFTRGPPKFSAVLETSVAAQNAPVLGGDCCPPGKGCNRANPSSRDETGVLQPLLHRTQERRPILDLRVLNRALDKLCSRR